MSSQVVISPGAVFLSYASEDSEAARRIAVALRAAGVEVWFDQSELVGGDAWDAKIRGQIAACALFVPVISANTQARLEGYFRIEWKLAAQRTHAMAEEKAFLLPVVIDDTSDAGAKVPAEFKAVQWTRFRAAGLSAGDGAEARAADAAAVAAFCARVKALLGGAEIAPGRAAQTGKPRAGQRDGDGASPGRKPVTSRRGGRWTLLGLVAAAALTVAIWPSRKGALQPGFVSASAAFPRDPELKRAWDMMVTANDREAFALAEDIAKAAVAQRPTDPEPTIVYAWINNGYVNRGFDPSEERHVLARRYAERAVQLAPDDPDALAALGQFLSFRGADLPRAEQLLRRAIELKPGEPRFYRALAWNALRTLRPADALDTAERSARLFPGDPLIQYELGMLYDDAGRLDDMERAFDRTLAIAPIGGAMIWKAWLAGWVHGDVPAMKHWVERIPATARLTSRATVMHYQLSRLTQDAVEQANALRALQAIPGTWFRDFWFSGPKALLIGELFAAQGKNALARGQFEQALEEVRREKAAAPADPRIFMAECWTLIGLGRQEEARATLHVHRGLPRPEGPRLAGWWHSGIPAALLLGDRPLALEQLREISEEAALRRQVRVALQIDPRMAPFREDAAIAALVTEPVKADGGGNGR